MLIWYLEQRITQAGAYVIATNTDGIFLTNVSMEQAEQIARDYVEDYGMDVEPEPIDRFINRDTSDRKSTRLNSSHVSISYAVFCLKKKKNNDKIRIRKRTFAQV